MPLASSIVNAASEPVSSEIDARWTMAYAAALGDSLSAYMDTLRPSEFVAHPMFPVCFEWPLIVAMRRFFKTNSLTDEEATRGVHATHDLIIHRTIRPPETLRTRLVVAGVERRKPGAYQLTRLDTTDARNAPVCTSLYGSIYRGVGVEGLDRPADISMPPAAPADASARPRDEFKIQVPAGMAHVYTECARIFNPIHTEAALARTAGLPAIILHGTATLALAVSRIVESRPQSDPTRVSRIACRFGAMVTMPSTLTLRIFADTPRDTASSAGVFFEVLNSEGKLAIRDGFIGLRASENSNRES
ncbi:MAG TPA: MaoC/PaaZ C-terminal domain-containing protein [Sporolactobacillaceae bacterium]|nr:MaoC/PaaZ C-terminal domain-containing protein [Sporolactobacillaceae bacterium]